MTKKKTLPNAQGADALSTLTQITSAPSPYNLGNIFETITEFPLQLGILIATTSKIDCLFNRL